MNKGFLTLLFLAIAHFLVDLQIGIFSVYKTMANLDLAAAGTIGIVAGLIGEGSQLFSGPLSDSGYRRHMILGGMLLVCSASFFVYCENYFGWQVLLLLTYVGSGAFHPSAAGMVATIGNAKKGGFSFSVFQAGGILGLALSQILFYQAYTYFNGNTAFIALPTFALIAVCLFIPFVGDKIKRKPAHFSEIIKLFRQPHLRCLYSVLVCNQSFYWATLFLLPDVLHVMGCEDWVSFGGAHLAFILGGAIMVVPGGMLADRYSAKSVLIGSMAATIVFFAIWVGVDSINTLWIMSILACLGAAFNIVSPVALSLGQRYLPGKPSLVSAFLMGMVWCVAESIGPSSGILTKLFSEGNAPLQALILLSVLGIVGFVMALRLPDLQEDAEPQLASS